MAPVFQELEPPANPARFNKQIKRGAHRSVKALIADIMSYIAKRNAELIDGPTAIRAMRARIAAASQR